MHKAYALKLARSESGERDRQQTGPRALGVNRDRIQKKTLILAALVHELRQPLQVIRASLERFPLSETAESRRLQTQRGMDMLERIDVMLERVLRSSRLELGGVVPTMERVDMDAVMRFVADCLGEQAEARGLRLRCVPCGLIVESDREMLLTILVNLVSNAIKFTVQGGVVIGCRRRGATVRLDVVDTGCGIADDQQTRIFDDFCRIARAQEGFGLGLGIVERTAKLLNARVSVTSRLGYGSCFTVAFRPPYVGRRDDGRALMVSETV